MAPIVVRNRCIIDPTISYETYIKLTAKSDEFKKVLGDVTKDPVKIFDPLEPRLVEQLLMLREMSKTLQLKKDEDIRKAAEKAEEMKQKAEEKPAETEQKESDDNTVKVANDDGEKSKIVENQQ